MATDSSYGAELKYDGGKLFLFSYMHSTIQSKQGRAEDGRGKPTCRWAFQGIDLLSVPGAIIKEAESNMQYVTCNMIAALLHDGHVDG